MSFICGEYPLKRNIQLNSSIHEMVKIGSNIDQGTKTLIEQLANLNIGYGVTENSWQTNIARSSEHLVFFDGAIYNEKELVNIYNLNRSETHSEFILTLLQILDGKKLVDILRGDYVFGILSLVDQKIALCRSLFGIRPLYYYFDDEKTVWASNLEQLTVHVQATQNSLKSYLAEYLCCTSQGRMSVTPFNNVFSVVPGQFISFTRGRRRITETQHPADKSPINIPFDEAVKRLKTILDSSVERRLFYPKTGLMFSGGVDSSAVAKSIYDINLKKQIPIIELIHFRFPGESEDDLLATTLADYIKMKIKFIDIKQTANFDLFNTNDSIIPCSRALAPIDKSHKMGFFSLMLSGVGGDQVFTGIDRNKLYRMPRNYVEKDNRAIFNDLSQTFQKKWDIKYRQKKRRLVKRFQREEAEHSFQMLIYGSQWVANHSFNKVVSPYLDIDLIEYVLSLPSDYRFSNGLGKIILRKTVSDIDNIMQRRTKGDHSQMVFTSINNDLERMIKESNDSLLEKMNVLNRGTLEKYVLRLKEGTLLDMVYMIRLFELESWVRIIERGENKWLK